jgi:hypothetical protein
LEISDILDGYSSRDLEKYMPDPSTVLFVEDSYLYHSEYLQQSLLDVNSGPVAIISDSRDIISAFNCGEAATLMLRPIQKDEIAELINHNMSIIEISESFTNDDSGSRIIGSDEESGVSGESSSIFNSISRKNSQRKADGERKFSNGLQVPK